MSEYRPDLIAEALIELREAMQAQRANEAAANMEELHENLRAHARNAVSESRFMALAARKKIEHQVSLLKQQVLDIEKEIEILGEDVFDQDATRQQLLKQIDDTTKQLQYADAI
jgi:hypothetical protein